MRKYFIIVLFTAFIAMTNSVKAQIFLGEAFVGLNICQVDGDQMMGYFKKGEGSWNPCDTKEHGRI